MLRPFVHKRTETAHPVPTKVFSKLSPETAMLFAAFGCTHPPPHVPPFLLTLNLSPKDIDRSDIMKMKVSCRLDSYIQESVNDGMKECLKIHVSMDGQIELWFYNVLALWC